MQDIWCQASAKNAIACDPTIQRCLATTGNDVLANNSVKLDNMGFDCIILVVLNLAFRLVGAFFLWRRTDKQAPDN